MMQQTVEEKAHLAIQVAQRELEGVLKSGRYSPGLLFELTQQILDGLDINPIIDEIRHLEDAGYPSRTRKARQFQAQVLKGIWYKHYFQTQFLVQNIREELSLNYLRRFLLPYAKRNDTKFVVMSENVIDDLVHDVVHGSFKRRASRNDLTGEYIVFDKFESKNYYMTLAKHKDEEATFNRVQKSRQWDAEVSGARLLGFQIAGST